MGHDNAETGLEKLKENLSLGSCGFHILHCAYNILQKCTDWKLGKCLQGVSQNIKTADVFSKFGN